MSRDAVEEVLPNEPSNHWIEDVVPAYCRLSLFKLFKFIF